jgi:ribosomal protein S18 acetylase RimI-like enzyme/predicted double-glycine peptidase
MSAAEPAPSPRLREATADDLEALLRLEEQSFATDRLSRRSFRRFLSSDADHLLVAEDSGGLRGYVLLLKRRGTRLARLYSICVDAAARGRGIAERLILAGEDAVRRAGCAYVRLEVRRDNPGAIRLYRRLGYRLFDTLDDYYEDGEQALRFEKRIRFYAGPRADLFVPYYNQTTPFTCGPACLMMAMKALSKDVALEQREELRIWREATTVYMTSGHGGCGPQGLALAAARRGFTVQMFLNDDGVLFLDSVRGEQKKQVLRVVHADYHDQVLAAGIPVHYRPLTLSDLQQALASQLVPVVLISAWRLTREKAPHWVVVAAIDDDFVYIHDPEIKWDRDETDADKQNVPIDRAAFASMARFGQWSTRAALLLGLPRRRRRRPR